MPLPDASVDVATSIFLFHELPPEVRREVTREIARVLKPGGMFVFLDSLQLGDKPDWDGLLQSFPYRFHEPYYHGYLGDGLEVMRLLGAATARELKAKGRYSSWRIAIGADGVWHSFRKMP